MEEYKIAISSFEKQLQDKNNEPRNIGHGVKDYKTLAEKIRGLNSEKEELDIKINENREKIETANIL